MTMINRSNITGNKTEYIIRRDKTEIRMTKGNLTWMGEPPEKEDREEDEKRNGVNNAFVVVPRPPGSLPPTGVRTGIGDRKVVEIVGFSRRRLISGVRCWSLLHCYLSEREREVTLICSSADYC